MRNRQRYIEELHAAQASAWVETLRNPAPADEAEFVAWLKESPRNVRDFLLMYSVDEALTDIDAERRRDAHALIERIDRGVAPLASLRAVRARPKVQVRAPRVLMAACGLLLFLAGIGFWAWPRHASEWRSFETATGEQRAFELDDGSVVHLNTHSRVAIRFSRSSRDVRLLEGEALFRVHHEAARPFRVYTQDAVVRAVGTQFDVYQRSGETVVAVIEGTVNIAAASADGSAPRDAGSAAQRGFAQGHGAASRNLGASEQAEISRTGLVSVRALPDVAAAVAWRERRLVFRQQPLEQVVEEFNRYSRRQIRLDGAGVAERTYSGVFDIDDVDSFAQVLARDPELIVDESDRSVVVRHR
jgi:transmembrane sensor